MQGNPLNPLIRMSFLSFLTFEKKRKSNREAKKNGGGSQGIGGTELAFLLTKAQYKGLKNKT
jgi:hypothetical protein